jgi:DNA primase
MARRIPEDTIEAIRSRTSIADVIGQYVKLKRRGTAMLGLCPFHNEKSPSFSVNAERGFFHCFGCGESGNAISFLMKHDGLGFREAVEKLGNQVGIPIPQDDGDDRSADQARKDRERYFGATDFAQQLFERALWGESHPKALEYLRGRGIDDDTARAFGLGYAPDAWSSLLEAAEKRGIRADDLDYAGMVKQRENGGYYDRFRDRIVFPVYGLSRQILAFSGRALSADDPAKYLNSPETRYYRKGRELFGIHVASREIQSRGRAIIVEGNFDVVSMHARGFPETVAALGTALTDDQARLLRRFTETVVLLYDGDNAGRKAAEKAFAVLMANDMPDVRLVKLPDGVDPDDYARKHGSARLGELIHQSRPMLDELLNRAFDSADGDVASRGLAAREVASVLVMVRNPLLRDPALQEAARRLEMNPRTLNAEVGRAGRAQQERQAKGNWEEKQSEDRFEDAPPPLPPPPQEPVESDRQNWEQPEDTFYQDAPKEERVIPHTLVPEVTHLWTVICARPAVLDDIYREQLEVLIDDAMVQQFIGALSTAWVEGHTVDPMSFAERSADRPLLAALQQGLLRAEQLDEGMALSAFEELAAEMKSRWASRELRRLTTQFRDAESSHDAARMQELRERQALLLDYKKNLSPEQ